jgi:hypothetical protein
MPASRFVLAAMAIALAGAAALQAFATSRGEDISRSSSELWYFTFNYAVALWVETDRRARGIPAPFEYSAGMFFFWPLLAPRYLFRTRRWRGLALGVGLFVLFLLPSLAGIAAYFLSGGE